MAADVTAALVWAPVSSAHCCLAPSIWRRLLMHAFFCDCVRARTKFGMAIEANRPMITTTIMISTRVKPELRDVLFFILARCLSVSRRELATGGLYEYSSSSLIACCNRLCRIEQVGCQSAGAQAFRRASSPLMMW